MQILLLLLLVYCAGQWIIGNFVQLNNVVPGTYYPRQIAGAPVAGTTAVQTLTITATGGSAKLSFDGFRTVSLAFGVLAATLQTALRNLPNIGATGVTVTGTGPFTLTFGGPLAKKSVPTITVVESTATGGTFAIANTTPGVDATHRLAPIGAKLSDVTNGIDYINTTAPPSPTWVKVGTQT